MKPYLPALLLLSLSACATLDGSGPDIPENAVESTRTEPNGDVISEYRVAGQLRVVKVTPARGPTFYLYDRDGDGRADRDNNVSPVYFKLFGWK